MSPFSQGTNGLIHVQRSVRGVLGFSGRPGLSLDPNQSPFTLWYPQALRFPIAFLSDTSCCTSRVSSHRSPPGGAVFWTMTGLVYGSHKNEWLLQRLLANWLPVNWTGKAQGL